MKNYKIDAILKGKDTSKKFSEKHLLKMCDWDVDKSRDPRGEFDIDGFTYRYNSDWEKRVVLRLKESGYAKLVRGQNIKIPYKTCGKKKNYCPDIVLLNYRNEIVFIEIKPLVNMCCEEIIDKYRGLEKYCKRHGYLYCMCDQFYRDASYLDTIFIRKGFKDIFFSILYKNKRFVKEDLKTVKEAYGKHKSLATRYVAALVKQYNLKFKEGDLTNNIPKMLIRIKKTSIPYDLKK